MDITNAADAQILFSDEEEQYISRVRASVKEHADMDLRRIIGITSRIKKMVETDEVNEFGDPIEDWDRVSTKDLINIFSEAMAWNYYSTPIRLQAFIESSLAELTYKYQFNTELTDPTNTGTVAHKNAMAELNTQTADFANAYRKLYTTYVTEVMKSYDQYLRRLERIIDWRLQEERSTAKSPFDKR